MAAKKKAPPKNIIAVRMRERYSNTTSKMKDKRLPRGGSKNKIKEILNDEEK